MAQGKTSVGASQSPSRDGSALTLSPADATLLHRSQMALDCGTCGSWAGALEGEFGWPGDALVLMAALSHF